MKPTVPEVLPLVCRYYAKNPVGGNLHIVLDDGNVADHHVDHCLERARDCGDSAGVELANLLRRMSKTQRKKLHSLPHRDAA